MLYVISHSLLREAALWVGQRSVCMATDIIFLYMALLLEVERTPCRLYLKTCI
jgi:hypothetical protein